MYLGITKTTMKKNLEWGPEEFDKPIERCRTKFVKPIITSMKPLYVNFFTPSETGDNRFQPIFQN